MAGWNADTAAGPLGAGLSLLVEGSSFCISLPNGDIHLPSPTRGLFQDTRLLSGWLLTVNGRPLEPLAAKQAAVPCCVCLPRSAIALDKDKRPVDACASNMGQCLLFGIVDAD